MEKTELDKLIKLVDEFVSTLKKDLLSIEVPAKGVFSGVWDKMKNFWHNVTKKEGPNDPSNPYVYRNKFGALGQAQESKRMSLAQYKFIREVYEDLESSVDLLSEETSLDSENVKKLKLFKIIDVWATKFKQAIIHQFSNTNAGASLQFVGANQPNIAPKKDIAIGPDRDDEEDEKEDDVIGMSGVPENKPEEKDGSIRPNVGAKLPSLKTKTPAPENSVGVGRPGSGLIISWSGDKFVVRGKVDGVAQARKLNLEDLLPVSVLRTKTKNQIQNLKSSAENYIKFIVYDDLTSQLPGETRHRAGQEDEPVLFEVDEEEFDKQFKIVFQQVLEKTSKEYSGQGKTKGKDLQKLLISRVYEKMDEIFKDRGEKFDLVQAQKIIDDALGDINS